MAISASQVKDLREMTGLGMMVCKKALEETNGDVQKAIENLRKQGQNTAMKRADRATKEGKVSIALRDNIGIVYEVNSETDFVARNEDFLGFVDVLGALLADAAPADIESAAALRSSKWNNLNVNEKITELMGKIGEKISFRRMSSIKIDPSKQRLFSYIHGDGKIGVLVALSVQKSEALGSEAVSTLGKELSMQVAAAKPIGVDRKNISPDVVAKEKEIYLSQAQLSGRPEPVWEKIVEGKMSKFYQESALLEQGYIRDVEISVTELVNKAAQEAGSEIIVNSFIRYALGGE